MNETHLAPGVHAIAGSDSLAPGVVSTKSAPPRTDIYLTVNQAAEIVPLHPVTILKWAREGRIPHRRLGRKVIFPQAKLYEWLESEYTEPAVRTASTDEREAA